MQTIIVYWHPSKYEQGTKHLLSLSQNWIYLSKMMSKEPVTCIEHQTYPKLDEWKGTC